MIFIKSLDDAYSCEDWCDLKGEETFLGCISKSFDGFWRFNPARGVSLTCKHMRLIAEKISDLNKDLL